MNVLLTIDTELSPGRSVATPADLDANVRGSFYGVDPGNGGLPLQLQLLREHGLKAVFFVEALAALVSGDRPVRDVVNLIQGAEQEVQLHLHTEWLALAKHNPLGDKCGQNMRDFSESDQVNLIRIGMETLTRCGAGNLVAFRAGNYGADNATLRALAKNGVRFDSSYDYPYLGRECRIDAADTLVSAIPIEGIIEVPVTFFEDRPGHFRHAQVCACSFGELSHMLMRAHDLGFETFVIVCHSFELLNRARTRVHHLLVRRFRRLCEFLGDQRQVFQTTGFNDLQIGHPKFCAPLSSSPFRTMGRYAEQLVGRIYE